MVIGVALVAGVLLFVASVSRGAVLAPLAFSLRGSWFDAVMFGLAFPALPFGLWKARHADVRERRRYSVFVAGLALGFLPMAAQVLAEATVRRPMRPSSTCRRGGSWSGSCSIRCCCRFP